MHGDGCRADVASDAIGLVLEAGIERNKCCRSAVDGLVNGGGDLPVASAQDLLNCSEQIGVDRQVLEAPIRLDCGQQPIQIAERLVHVRLFNLDITHVNRRIALDHAAIGILAHDLRIDHGVLRDVDDQIAQDPG